MRKNFHREDRLEASEEAQDNDDQNDSNLGDNAQADICNEEEYNKIFRPQKEIRRPGSSSSINQKKLGQMNKKNAEPKAAADTDKPAVDQSFFVDIKVAPKPSPTHAPPLNLPPIKHEVFNGNNGSIVKNESVYQSVSHPVNVKVDKLEERMDKFNMNDFLPSAESQSKINAMDFSQNIESGHDVFIRTLKIRNKNISMIKQMW